MVCFTAAGTGTEMHYVFFGSVIWVVGYRADAGADWFWLTRERAVRHVREWGFGERSSRQIYDL